MCLLGGCIGGGRERRLILFLAEGADPLPDRGGIDRPGLSQPDERIDGGCHVGDGRILVREGFDRVDRAEDPECLHIILCIMLSFLYEN